MSWSATVIKLFIWCVATKWSPSTALQSFDEVNEGQNKQNVQLDAGKDARHLRRTISRYSSQGADSIGQDAARGQIVTRSNEPGQTNMVFQQDLSEVGREQSSSTSISSESGGFQFQYQEQDQSQIQVCRTMDLNFSKAANGRGMSGGEFVRGEWYHLYGLNIYAEDHDGKNNLHPMIFDSSHVESNGLSSKDVFALGSPNFDCEGFGVGTGGKVGKSGENCEPLGNLLIPSRKQRSLNFNLSTRGTSYQPSLGGVLIFEFDKKTRVDNIGFLNIGGSDQILVIHNDGSYDKIELVSADQNGFQNVHLDLDSVKKLYVNLHSFGAITGLDLCITVD